MHKAIQRCRDNLRLFINLLKHKVGIIAFTDHILGDITQLNRTLHDLVVFITNDHTAALNFNPVPIFQITKLVGQRGQSIGIASQIHLAVAITNR